MSISSMARHKLNAKRNVNSLSIQLGNKELTDDALNALHRRQVGDTELCVSQLLELKHSLKEEVRQVLLNGTVIPNGLLAMLSEDELKALLEIDTGSQLNKYDHEAPRNVNNKPFVNVPELDISSVRKDQKPDSHRSEHSIDDVHLVQQVEQSQSHFNYRDPILGEPDFDHDTVEIIEVSDSSTDNNSRREAQIVNHKSYLIQNAAPNLTFIPSKPVYSAPLISAGKDVTVQTENDAIVTQDIGTAMSSIDSSDSPRIGINRGRTDEDSTISNSISTSADDRSAGQVSQLAGNLTTVLSIRLDGSLARPAVESITPSAMSPSIHKSESPRVVKSSIGYTSSPASAPSLPLRSPRVFESPWRPSKRPLQIVHRDISTSYGSDEIECVSAKGISSPRAPPKLAAAARSSVQSAVRKTQMFSTGDQSPSTTGSSDLHEKSVCESSSSSSHQDEEATYNQVSHIYSA